MTQSYSALQDILTRTYNAVHEFMNIISPSIEHAKDEHEHLYWHHIYEEEEQRVDRLKALLPKLQNLIEEKSETSLQNSGFVRLLQDVSLEKFGLHNFLEHLDLALFQFENKEPYTRIKELRDVTKNDYDKIKIILNQLNEEFDGAASAAGSTPTDEKEDVHTHLKVKSYLNEQPAKSSNEKKQQPKTQKKRLTVGSLKSK